MLSWTDIGALAPGQQAVIRFTAAPTQTVIETPGVGLSVPHVNTAVATGQDRTGATGNATGSYSAGPDDAQARIRSSDLVLTKSAPSPVVPAGSTGQYVISIRNDGPDPAIGPFTVADQLPPNLVLQSAVGDGWTCLQVDPALNCTRSTPTELAPGASLPDIVLTMVVPSTTPDGQVFENIAAVRGSSLDTNPRNNADNAFLTAQRVADLRIVKTTRTNPVVPGGTITYDLVVSNLGVSVAEGPIVVGDPLPAPLRLSTVTGDGWTCVTADSQVTCSSPGDLPAGGTLPTITVVAEVPADALGTLTNTATTASVSTDPDLSNNTSTVTDPLVPSADLFVEKETVTDPLVAGREVTYTLRAGNLGPSVSRAPITVTDTLPTGLTFVSAAGPGWSCTAAVSCTYGVDLPPNVSAPDITVTALVGSDVAGSVTNPATVTGTTPDPNPVNNRDEVTDPVTGLADLAVVKTTTSPVVPGREVTYSVVVTNNGPSTSRQPITVTDTLAGGLTFVSASGPGWTCDAAIACVRSADLPAGASADPITVVALLDSGFTGDLVNTAVVAGTTPDPVPGNNTSTVTDPAVPSADLAIAKTTATAPLVPGQDVTYQLAVRNLGPSTSRQPITVQDPLPAGLTFVSASGTGWTCDPAVRCVLAADVAAGADAPLLTVRGQLDPAFTGDLVNTATVTGTTPDPDPGNNTSTVTDPTVPSADLAIAKRALGPVLPGRPVSYEIVVTNLGPSVVAAADHRGGHAAAGADPGLRDRRRLGVRRGGLRAQHRPRAGRGRSGDHRRGRPRPGVHRRGDQHGDGHRHDPDPDPDNNTATVTDPARPQADLAITKRTMTTELAPGGEIVYELEVSNNGPSVADAPITVRESLPDALTLVSAAGDGWVCTEGTCERGEDLLVGQTAPPITITATIGSSFFGDLTNVATVTGPTPDPDPDNNTATVTDPVDPVADLSHQGGRGPFTVGGAGSSGSPSATTAHRRPGPDHGDRHAARGPRFVSAAGPAPVPAADPGLTCVVTDGLAAGAATVSG